jgi:hypothetical protein
MLCVSGFFPYPPHILHIPHFCMIRLERKDSQETKLDKAAWYSYGLAIQSSAMLWRASALLLRCTCTCSLFSFIGVVKLGTAVQPKAAMESATKAAWTQTRLPSS